MAAKKKTTRRAPARKPSPAAEAAQFQREHDLRMLKEAEVVRGDPARLRGAQREARDQRRALDRIAKK